MSITSLYLDAEHAIQLGNALRHGAVAAKSTANTLVLSLGGKRLGFNGWDSYVNVVGATHNAKAQLPFLENTLTANLCTPGRTWLHGCR